MEDIIVQSAMAEIAMWDAFHTGRGANATGLLALILGFWVAARFSSVSLEKNVNLVHFENNRIEISFNDNLDKNFIKDLSLKLFEWTGDRWIITLSKSKGELSIKDKQKNKKIKNINSAKQSKLYKNLIEKFPDADLIDVKPKEEND